MTRCMFGHTEYFAGCEACGEVFRSKPKPPAVAMEPIMQFFGWEHLPPHLQEVSQPFGMLALNIVETLPRNAERTVALRKLLEAKDAAVRARLYVSYCGTCGEPIKPDPLFGTKCGCTPAEEVSRV